mmetsp:Transcript_116630/g.249372  ORF Transcript_116630/g.249372 Transcript_116630/m.249372 type:complete len:247 (-) Transcript_116630:16-756(-)
MAASAVGRGGPRLAVLLKGFGLSPVELAGKESKEAVVTLRSHYYQLAKELHPDRASPERKADASEKFAALTNDFDEALGLLEAGVRPWVPDASPGSYAHGQEVGSAERWRYNPQQVWQERERPFVHRQAPVFDTKTRVKGHLIVWSGLFFFCCFMREFLVWSAGSYFAWSMPQSMNIFWVRRFQDEWTDTAKADRERQPSAEEVATKLKVAKIAQKKDRGLDNFYQKRHISNTRKHYEPRGLGRSL